MRRKKRSKTKRTGGSSGRARSRAASLEALGDSAPGEVGAVGEVAREELDELAQYHDTSPVLAGPDNALPPLNRTMSAPTPVNRQRFSTGGS